MATYEEIYNLRNSSLVNRVEVAVAKAAYDVRNEVPETANHANRIIWAASALVDPKTRANEMMWQVLSNATIQASGQASTDNDIQFVVNSLVDSFATGA